MLEGIRNNAQSIWVKIAFGLIILVFVFWGIGSSVQSTSNVVARVNGEDITEQEFLIAYSQQAESVRASFPDFTDEMLAQINFSSIVLEELVVRTLLDQEAQRTGINVTPRELYNVISTISATHDENGNFNQEIYEEAVRASGQSPAAFEEALRLDMLEDKFRVVFANFAYASPLQVRSVYDFQYNERAFDAYIVNDADFLATANPTEEELRALYEETQAQYQSPARIKLEFIEVSPEILMDIDAVTDEQIQAEYTANQAIYDTPEIVTASHILLMLEENASEEAEAQTMTTLAEIQAQLAEGANFGELARQYSADTVSAEQDGALGSFTRGQMVEEFENAAFSQEVGTVSEPVRTQFGYHLIYVEDKVEAQALPQEEMRAIVGAELAYQAASSRVQSVVDSLIVQADGTRPFVDVASSEGLIVQTTPLLSFEELAATYAISETYIEEMRNAQANTVLEPILTSNSMLVARVVENVPAQAEAYEEVQESILAMAKEQKAHELALAHANELLADTSAIDSSAIQSSTISREGASSLTISPELASAIFAAPSDSTDPAWLTQAFEIEEGYIIVMPKEIVEADEAMWLAQEPLFLQQMEDSREDMLFAIYVQELRENATVEIVNQAYFE